jgi:anti-sigma regulatory factor (Ser/Thr protein kinase)
MTLPRELRAEPEGGRTTSSSRALPQSAASPGLARELVRDVLAGRDPEAVELAQVLTSELVTNAVLHARSVSILQIDTDGPLVKVSVEDSSSAQPEPRNRPMDEEGGLGLILVNAMATAWGWFRTATGKQVWFELHAEVALQH